MTWLLKSFDFFEPKTVTEAGSILSKHGFEAAMVAGGTDLFVLMKKRYVRPKYIVNIRNIPDLDYIDYNKEDGLRIGAMATLQAIANSPIIRVKFGALAAACNKVGTPQIRNMATIGGNICKISHSWAHPCDRECPWGIGTLKVTGSSFCKRGPSPDTPPALLVYDARLKLVSPNGERIVPIDEFYRGPFRTVLKDEELLTEIQIPHPSSTSAGCYRWFTKFVAVDETVAGVAIQLSREPSTNIIRDAKIALCAIAPVPLRARKTEETLRGQKFHGKLIEDAMQVIFDETKDSSKNQHRRRMAGILLKEAINEAWQRIR